MTSGVRVPVTTHGWVLGSRGGGFCGRGLASLLSVVQGGCCPQGNFQLVLTEGSLRDRLGVWKPSSCPTELRLVDPHPSGVVESASWGVPLEWGSRGGFGLRDTFFCVCSETWSWYPKWRLEEWLAVLSGDCRLLVEGAKHFLEFLKMIFHYLFIFRFYVSTAAFEASSQFELDSIWRFICLIFHLKKMLCQLYLNIIPSFFYGTFCIIFYFIDPIRPCEVLRGYEVSLSVFILQFRH
jgi:hypothetical protein